MGLWTPQNTFAALSGNVNASTLDANFGDAYNYPQYCTSVSGTNALTMTAPQSFSAYAAGMRFGFVASANNTGAVTIDVNGKGAVAVNWGGVALVRNQIVVNCFYEVFYDGSVFRLMGATAPFFLVATATGGGATYDMSMNTSVFYEYLMILDKVVPVTAGTALYMRFGTGGVYDAGANYNFARSSVNSIAVGADGGLEGANEMRIIGDTDNAAFYGCCGQVRFRNGLSGQGMVCEFDTSSNSSTFHFTRWTGAGINTTAATRNQVRLLFSAGNISSGNVYLYGYVAR